MKGVRYLITLLGVSLFYIYLLYTRKVETLLSPKLFWTVYLNLLVFSVFFLNMEGWWEKRTPKKSDLVKGILLSLLYLYPFFLFLSISPEGLERVNKPVVKEIKQEGVKRKRPIKDLPTDRDGFVNLNLFELWLLSKNYPELTQAYRFKTAGKVEGIEGDTLKLRRSFITCCIADATPVEVEAKINKDHNVKVGDWVEVWGAVLVKGYVVVLVQDFRFVEDKGLIQAWSETPPFNP